MVAPPDRKPTIQTLSRELEDLVSCAAACRIREWRTRRGLTQSEFAAMLGVHANTVYRLEKAVGLERSGRDSTTRYPPSLDTLCRAAVATGMSVAHLVEITANSD